MTRPKLDICSQPSNCNIPAKCTPEEENHAGMKTPEISKEVKETNLLEKLKGFYGSMFLEDVFDVFFRYIRPEEMKHNHEKSARLFYISKIQRNSTWKNKKSTHGMLDKWSVAEGGKML